MGDNKIGHSDSQRPFDAGPNGRVDLFLRSESPRVQQILLHQQLKEDIERNSSGRVRYIDSELYLRNHERSPASSTSEVQSTTLNIGVGSGNVPKSPQKFPISTASSSSIKRDVQALGAGLDFDDVNGGSQPAAASTNCQVCQIKEVRQDLMTINTIVQERNEQISKLKAKLKAQSLRSYFERQMKD